MVSPVLSFPSVILPDGFNSPKIHGGEREIVGFSFRMPCTMARRRYLRSRLHVRSNTSKEESTKETSRDGEVSDLGVRVALSMLRFYRGEISPLLPSTCRYIPTCSVYSMEAYKRYGVVKGTILTAWRLCRCNPFGGHGFDPPRWFGEEKSL
ncbi:hypothetical protein HPP92_019244 [Vanilla planifolia]|uniref:Membrane protein insertion efficiency factor n=1 Tax=Vanilla planifolia TaxID=51239 RepID=A0A835ULJ4_VANPL|nr:hypothetical protein HPP92_019244 [Vanilla planifolia]